MLLPFLNFSQNHFKALEQKENINTIIIDEQMLKVMSNMEVNSNDKESKEYSNLLKSIKNVNVYIDDSGKHQKEMINMFKLYSSKYNLKEKKTPNNNVICYLKEGSASNIIEQLLLFTENINKQNETIIVFVEGNFKIEQAEMLIQKMKIPGAKIFSNIQ
jgi:inosine/xanthosine triphosphate pyrophosphatase family protein